VTCSFHMYSCFWRSALIRKRRSAQFRSSYQVWESWSAMGTCLAVEVRAQPATYYDRYGLPRHTIVRPKNKSVYRVSDELSLYRPRSRLSIRRDDYRLQDDFRNFDNRQDDYNYHYRSPAQAGYRPFEPLPPPVPPPPMIRNDPHEIVDLTNLPLNNPIEVIEAEPGDNIRRSPHSRRGRRRTTVYSSRRGGNERRYYDDSDDDSWVQRSPRSWYSDDSSVEVIKPGRSRTRVWRSRSRNNSRSYRS
jgi:hypothetical protein